MPFQVIIRLEWELRLIQSSEPLLLPYAVRSFQLFTEEPRIENGEIVLSQQPGPGIEFDEDALDRFEVR